ncbi:hypothetical protein T440DRAFT_544221, partial [Plenodomus tracheiphilus IPT5]
MSPLSLPPARSIRSSQTRRTFTAATTCASEAAQHAKSFPLESHSSSTCRSRRNRLTSTFQNGHLLLPQVASALLLQRTRQQRLGPFRNISIGAFKHIIKLLHGICNEATVPKVHIPKNFEAKLKLRQTAYTMSSVDYVAAVEELYLEDLDSYTPHINEINTLMKYSLGEDDDMVTACANRISFLVRSHVLTRKQKVAFANLVGQEKYARSTLERGPGREGNGHVQTHYGRR